MRQMTWRVVDLIANLVSCHCHQFLYSNKHIFLVIVMNIFSFLLYFRKEKKIILSTVLTRLQII